MVNLLDLFFPPVCAGCHRLGTWLCNRCQTHLARLNPSWDLIQLLHLPTELQHVWSAVEYRDVATDIVTQVKYQRCYCYTKCMAEIVDLQLHECLQSQNFDALIPIPLSPARQKWRGFNQAEKFSGELSKLLHIPTHTNILFRQGKNISQVHKNQEQRLQFASQFYCSENIQIKGKKLCLVDDVITTGTTLKEASLVLQSAGAQTQCLTFGASISGNM
jgi:ComF family protein